MAHRKKFKKRSTKKKTMATKKRRRKKTLSAPGKKRKRTRARKGRKRRFLRDALTPMQFKHTLKTIGGGALGTAPVIIAENMGVDNLTPIWKGGVLYGMAAAASVMGQDNLAAGIAGAATYKLYRDKQAATMSENSGMAKYTKELAQLPMFLNEDNTPMALSQGDYFLSEGVDYMLSENMYGMPSYGPRM